MKNERGDNGQSNRNATWCAGCHLRFGSAESRFNKSGKYYHSHCLKKTGEKKRDVEAHLEVEPRLESVQLKDNMMLDERYLETLYYGDFDL